MKTNKAKLIPFSVEHRYLFEKTEMKSITITERVHPTTGKTVAYYVQREVYEKGDWRYVGGSSKSCDSMREAIIAAEIAAGEW